MQNAKTPKATASLSSNHIPANGCPSNKLILPDISAAYMQGVPKIPYFQTSRYRVQAMVELAKPKPNELGADLGSGDGRIVIEFAKTGLRMHGYEIDEGLKQLSEERIKQEGLNNAFIHNKDFWNEDLSRYDIICCYPMPTIMGRLEKKLQQELRIGSRVLLNYFPFLHWKESAKKDNIFLYRR